MDPYTREMLARERQQDLLREAVEDRKAALLPRTSVRERVAQALVALALRLTPALRETLASEQPASTGVQP